MEVALVLVLEGEMKVVMVEGERASGRWCRWCRRVRLRRWR